MLSTIQFVVGCLSIVIVVVLIALISYVRRQDETIQDLTDINEELFRNVQSLARQVDQLKSERSILMLRLDEKENNKKGRK